MKYASLFLLLGLALVSSPQVDAQVSVTPLYSPDEILVRFESGVTVAEVDAAVAQIGASVEKRLDIVDNLYLVKLPEALSPPAAVAALKAQGGTLYAEPNYTVRAVVTPNDSSFGSLWGLHNTGQSAGTADADIDAPEAWNITTGSSSVVVVVIDTGIDYNHPDLAANMFRNEADCDSDTVDDDGNGYVNDCYGIDTYNNDSAPFDDHNHGTHVAGTIGAVGNNGVGVVGVNWNVRLMACKFLNSGGSGSIDDAIDCLTYVAMMKDRGVNIVATNNSWGGGGFSQAMQDAIDIHRQKGILFIAAAGNSAADNDSTDFWPANYYLPNVISVASTTRTDALSSFSDFGRQTVHVAAPGSDILSTTPNNTYQSFSGTSMATPHVTGVAALLKAQDSSRDWRAIRNLILSGGSNLSTVNGRTVTGKRLNAEGSLTCSNSVVQSRLRPIGQTSTASSGETITLAMLNINCASPNGAVNVSVDSGTSVALSDNGVSPDQVAGDGVYSGQTSFASVGAHTMTFPGGDVATVQILRSYSSYATAYSYRDISGTSLDLSDDSSSRVDSPFSIRFGGGSFDSLYVSSNGLVDLITHYTEYANVSIPSASKKVFVAALWDDLYAISPTAGSNRNVFWTVLGSSPNRELVIEWRNVLHFTCRTDNTISVKFQLVFLEGSSRVVANYADTVLGGACASSDRGGSATVGIQIGASTGTQWSNNSAIIENSTAIRWNAAASFTDETLTGVLMKAVHITELRSRIDTIRSARGLSAFTWTDPTLTVGSTTARAVHISELRTALNAAYSAAGLTLPTYTDPTLTVGSTVIKAAHMTELRSAVVALE